MSPRRADPGVEQALTEAGAAQAPQYPHYIRETEPEPFDLPFAGPTRRSEFVGGWSDWVDDESGRGYEHDDHPVRAADLVHLPGYDDDVRDDQGDDLGGHPARRGEDGTGLQDRQSGEQRAGRSRRGARRADRGAERPIGRADWLDEWPDGDDGRFGHTSWSGRTSWSDADIPQRGSRGLLSSVRARWPGAGRSSRRSTGRGGGPGAAVAPHLRREPRRKIPAETSRPLRRQAPRTLREHGGPSRLRVAVVLAIAVLLLAVLGGFALYLLHSHSAARAVRPAASVLLTGATAGRVLYCPTERVGEVVRGAEPGGTGSGPAAIMWFQHSFYVERSGERARQVVAPGAAVSPAAVIQRGIDSVLPGTAYCVRVTPAGRNEAGQDRFSVDVTELRPGGTPATYDKQTVTTTVVDGRTLITGITAG